MAESASTTFTRGRLYRRMAEIRHPRIVGKRKLEDEQRPRRAAPAKPFSDGTVCAKCAELDFRGALQKIIEIRETGSPLDLSIAFEVGVHVADVGHRYRQLRLMDCVLCPVLFASRMSFEHGVDESEYDDELRLIPFLPYSDLVQYRESVYQYEPLFLAVVPRHLVPARGESTWIARGILQNHVKNEGAAVLHPGRARLKMFAAQPIASHWLRYCKSNHSIGCGGSTNPEIPGLQLIDCVTLSIKKAKGNQPYVALSYVWGNPGVVDTKLRRTDNGILLPAALSLVISDAIKVAKALGFQYLWADKFCIDQDDADTKHEQIKQMRAIYENADLTIVAAAGTDETYGLPGVGQTPRAPQIAAGFNGMSVVSTMKHPHVSIRSSRWASRGWTLQEAILSRRRLVFTDQQLYFECNYMNCLESVYGLLDTLPTKKPDLELLGGVKGGIFGTLVRNEGTIFDVFHQYLSLIEDYTSRDLRYDADSLNAFQGIIERYSKSNRPVRAIWGMPYPVQGNERSLYFCWSLAWTHSRHCWGNSKQPRRRQNFPSWTWAGWAGPVRILQGVWTTSWVCNGVQSVRFGDRGDEEEDLAALNSTTPDSKCCVLRLLAKTVPPSEISCKLTEDGEMTWNFAEHEAKLFPSQAHILGAQFAQELMDVEQWRCVWICTVFRDSYCMVLERNHDTNTWTRAGMFCVCSGDLDMDLLMKNVDATWLKIE